MIRHADSAEDFAVARRLIAEYIDWLPFDLNFQDFESELAALAEHYGAPAGALFLATTDGGEVVGVVGVRAFGDGIAELKRMYVRDAGRGNGLGRQLAVEAIGFARRAGYRTIRLDSDQASMPAANALYENLGFKDIERYRPNHLPCARFMELEL
ncbi:MAG: GNAT family N-acetyltransferase [bacterium]|nr:GNAT family N-acetyltransferase [bacterium]